MGESRVLLTNNISKIKVFRRFWLVKLRVFVQNLEDIWSFLQSGDLIQTGVECGVTICTDI
jgi:hypothetical protein